MHVLSLGSLFQIFSCFVLGKCEVNHLHASESIAKFKWATKFGLILRVWVVFQYFGIGIWELYLMRLLTLRILFICGLTVVDVWLWECLTMYISNHCLAMLSASLNIILRALSFETVVVPWTLDWSDLIRELSSNL